MAQVINTNIASLNAQRNLNSSQAGTNQALERLSSGLRINSAKDDAAGLAISTRFTSQIKGLNMAVRNANDGISLAETAESSMGSMTDSLQRLRELAVQSANGSYSDADRQLLNEEAQALIAEVGRVADTANFNGVKLLDGSYNTNFQIGANAGETIEVSIGKLSTDALGVAEKSGLTASATDSALSVGNLTINGVAVGASKASDDSASTDNKAGSAIAKAAAINAVSDQSGVTAVVDENLVGGTSMTGAGASGSVTINGTEITLTTTTDTAATRTSVVDAINAQSGLTGVTAIDTGDDSQGIELVAADGRNVQISFDTVTAAATGLAAAGTYEGGVTLVANAGVDEIVIGGTATANAGLTAGTYSASVAATSTESRTQADNVVPDALVAGDLVINGVGIGAAVATDDTASYAGTESSSKEASAIAIAAAVNRSSAETGVTAVVNENIVSGTSTTSGAAAGDQGTLFLNGESITLTVGATLEDSRTAAVAAINAVSGNTGVVATDTGTGLSLSAADGRNIVMSLDDDVTNTVTAADFGIATAAVFADNAATAADGVTSYGTITLQSAGQFTVSSGNNGNAELEALGFEVGTFGGAEAGQFLKDVDLSTQAGATEALAAIDNALASITASRSELGAVQNRFTATIENLSATSEKFAAANSRIQDADFAAEAANLARSQALQQAGVSMLAQANAQSQQVLQLLG
ncbi:flagellin [Pseudohongiella spirulinae]|uniref:Flagellin n=1 Tax=Pseudohongiella spirulinae TaxID=1249552 RepID=A0A0S2KE93_9GAMM|nr:flagellin [Pseudohongiella spirulinae]ALO46646.1 Flagellin and related hook-associated protein [Pseudohongiella spirulinae]